MWEWKVYNNSHIIVALGTLFLGFVWAYDWLSGLVLTITMIFVYYYFRRYFTEQERQFFWYRHHVSKSIEAGMDRVLHDLGTAVVILDEIGRIDWANDKFSGVIATRPKAGDLLSELWPDFPFDALWNEHIKTVMFSGKTYRVTAQPYMAGADAHPQLIAYIEDITELSTVLKAYENIMPMVMWVQIDNLADAIQGLVENKSALLIAEITQRLNEWAKTLGAAIRKISADQYFVVINRAALAVLADGKFAVLDEIREIKLDNRIPVTISIGASVAEKSIADLGMQAMTNLDLALGRGGDQVVLTVDGETSFFGGKSKPTEKNTRVRARVTAAALEKVFREAGKIYVMGHSNEDFDCIGAALGIQRMAAAAGKKAQMVVGKKSKDIESVEKLLAEYQGYEDFIIVDTLKEETSDKDLLVIVDTHRPVLLSDHDFASRFAKFVVIDHHRRAEDYIDSPLLSYFEPSASSASEMVVELMHYFGDKVEEGLTHIEASILLAGIMLDTKNFTVQAGAKTFEAAASLRRQGADMMITRKLFISNFENFKQRAQIAASIERIGNGAVIGVCPEWTENAKVQAAITADWLLMVDEVRTALVLYYIDDNTIGISARSNGSLNVQVLMEKFGGGGHHTVAGAQISGKSVDEIKEQLRLLITENSDEENPKTDI